MPHIIVKLWPGKTEQQKRRLGEQRSLPLDRLGVSCCWTRELRGTVHGNPEHQATCPGTWGLCCRPGAAEVRLIARGNLLPRRC
jgi:hypothetical protein